jgi:hypothetical protein
MNLLLRLQTVPARLKLRLLEDDIDDTEINLSVADLNGPAWPPLTKHLFRCMDNRDALRRQLGAIGVPPGQQAMGTTEMLTWGLLSVLACFAVAGAAGWISA